MLYPHRGPGLCPIRPWRAVASPVVDDHEVRTSASFRATTQRSRPVTTARIEVTAPPLVPTTLGSTITATAAKGTSFFPKRQAPFKGKHHRGSGPHLPKPLALALLLTPVVALEVPCSDTPIRVHDGRVVTRRSPVALSARLPVGIVVAQINVHLGDVLIQNVRVPTGHLRSRGCASWGIGGCERSAISRGGACKATRRAQPTTMEREEGTESPRDLATSTEVEMAETND